MVDESALDVKNRIKSKLEAALNPEMLDVIDESDNHAGHGGWREGGATHFRIKVVSAAFSGKSRVDTHRIINGLLADELAGRVHALAIEAKAP
jgi:BolA family transcriptional regulator, general stress-responsive regulator